MTGSERDFNDIEEFDREEFDAESFDADQYLDGLCAAGSTFTGVSTIGASEDSVGVVSHSDARRGSAATVLGSADSVDEEEAG